MVIRVACKQQKPAKRSKGHRLASGKNAEENPAIKNPAPKI
jgi:hypothetical protein